MHPEATESWTIFNRISFEETRSENPANHQPQSCWNLRWARPDLNRSLTAPSRQVLAKLTYGPGFHSGFAINSEWSNFID